MGPKGFAMQVATYVWLLALGNKLIIVILPMIKQNLRSDHSENL